jgi:hypothetical protein
LKKQQIMGPARLRRANRMTAPSNASLLLPAALRLVTRGGAAKGLRGDIE